MGRSDYNTVFGLLGYVYLNTHHSKISLTNRLNVMMIITLLMMVADGCAIPVQQQAILSSVLVTVIVVLELVLKVLLLVLLGVWNWRTDKTTHHHF